MMQKPKKSLRKPLKLTKFLQTMKSVRATTALGTREWTLIRAVSSADKAILVTFLAMSLGISLAVAVAVAAAQLVVRIYATTCV